MFDQLHDKLMASFRKLSGRGVISESNVKDAVREIRIALLSADVHIDVVRKFSEDVVKKAVGVEVSGSIKPHEQFIKIVHDELVVALGGEAATFNLAFTPPVTIMMLGLQGSGKTTTSAKLGVHLQKLGRRVLLVPLDLRRPAAVEQLTQLGAECKLDVFAPDRTLTVAENAAAAQKFASGRFDTIILDTAGRLHIDDELMLELSDIGAATSPHHKLLVADAMTGQDAVKSAKSFHEKMGLTGVILTKLDGDAKGGAALSIKTVTGCPIVFAGVGERTGDLESFYPDRIASQLMGRGDMMSLVEKVAANVDNKEAEELGKKMMSSKMTLDDYRKQLGMMEKAGGVSSLMKMLPGFSRISAGIDNAEVAREIKRKKAIIDSMTPRERRSPKLLDGSRKKRIAKGSGTHPHDINKLLNEFSKISDMMKRFSGRGAGNLKNLLNIFGK